MSEVTVTVDGDEYTLDPHRDCGIDLSDINGELEDVAQLVQTYSTLYEFALLEEAKAKIVLNRIEAIVDARFREESQMANRKITEKMVHGVVITDAQFKKQQSRLMKLSKNVAILKSAKYGIEAKHRSLLVLGASLRDAAPARILDHHQSQFRREAQQDIARSIAQENTRWQNEQNE